MTKSRHILFVVNVCWFFISHRLVLAQACLANGWRVTLLTAGATPAERELLEQKGVQLIDIDIKRSGPGLSDVRLLHGLIRHFRQLRPDLVHLVTIKPVIFGGLAARLAKLPAVVYAISGLGYTFIADGMMSKLRRWLIVRLYRAALNHPNSTTIFQNPDDRSSFVDARITTRDRSVLIKGSGVDTRRLQPTPSPDGVAKIVLPARMLRDKGVYEFAAAAKKLREKGHVGEFILAGGIDLNNPAHISENEIRDLEDKYGVVWLGHVDDMDALFAEASIVCLPSYREGLPKSLLEAAAAGRAIVTTDVPGCREVVIHGDNGLLVRKGDVDTLAVALESLLNDRSMLLTMGTQGRKMAEKLWDVRTIAAQTAEVYEALL